MRGPLRIDYGMARQRPIRCGWDHRPIQTLAFQLGVDLQCDRDSVSQIVDGVRIDEGFVIALAIDSGPLCAGERQGVVRNVLGDRGRRITPEAVRITTIRKAIFVRVRTCFSPAFIQAHGQRGRHGRSPLRRRPDHPSPAGRQGGRARPSFGSQRPEAPGPP
jgi:hypothetical protein